MPEILRMADRVRFVSEPKDFEDLVERYMGDDARRYYRNQVEQLSNCIRDLIRYVNDKALADEIEEVLEINGF